MSASIFREYDIRGIFEKELNENIAKKIGFYLAKALKQRVPTAAYSLEDAKKAFNETK